MKIYTRAVWFCLPFLLLNAQPVQIWSPESWELVSPESSPAAGPPAVRMVGGRNTWASGLIAARGNAPFRNPRAEISDLQHSSGVAFPARLVTLRYGSRDHRDAFAQQHPRPRDSYFYLSTTPPETAGTLVVRITAEIPPTAPAGEYRGTVTLHANGQHQIPVQLLVGEGRIPDPGNYVSHVNYATSPDTVALRYGVPMWSAEHWQKLEASFRIYRALGQNVLHVPVILRARLPDGSLSHPTHYGSVEGMIRFRESGGRVEPDFQVFENMLLRWRDQVGVPQFIVLSLWDVSWGNFERDHLGPGLEAMVTGVNAQGHPRGIFVPYPGTPGSEALWQSVIQGARDRVARLGWDPASVLIGIAHDRKPDNRVVEFYNHIAPEIHWNVISHMRGYGIRDGRMVIGEMQVGYHEFPWNPDPRNMNPGDLLGGWNPDFPVATISRFHSMQTENALSHRWLGDGTVGSRGTRNRTTNIGPTRWKLEFWEIATTDDRGRPATRSLFNMQGWVNLIRNRTVLATAGPNGMEPTVFLMNNIESIQDTEARIAIEQLLRSEIRGTMPETLVNRAHTLIVDRGNWIVNRRNDRWASDPSFDQNAHRLELFQVLGEMQRLAAP